MTATHMVEVRIVWDDEAVSELRSEYLGKVESLEPGSEWPALHVVQLGLMGELQISVNDAPLFIEPWEVASEVNVLGLLLGLRFALDRVIEHGNQIVAMWPDLMSVFVEPEPNGLVSVWSPGRNVLRAPHEDWSRGLDRGLAETRQYLGERLPELRDDPLLGNWMKGAEPTYFKGVCISEQYEAPQFRRVLPSGYVPPPTHHPPIDESFIESVYGLPRTAVHDGVGTGTRHQADRRGCSTACRGRGRRSTAVRSLCLRYPCGLGRSVARTLRDGANPG